MQFSGRMSLASEASETLDSGVQLKIRDICLYYICGCTYVIYTLTLTYIHVSLVFEPVPNFTK